MKNYIKSMTLLSCGAALLVLAGCATESGSVATADHFPSRYRSPDGRNIDIGRRTPADGGWNFREPHMDKCWVASDFNFTGCDTLYILPTLSTAKLHNSEEESPHALAKENLVIELGRTLGAKGMFTNVVMRESDIKPGAHVYKLENTIIEYAKGGGAARYWAGLYGAGQPVLRVRGKLTDGDKVLFTYEAYRSGVSAGARLSGAFMSDVDIQLDDIRSLVLDLNDFMCAVAGKYTPKN